MTKPAEIRVPANEITVTTRSDASIAVVGSPNTGKSTLFNRLTGLKQRIGNYPGVTVEWKEGVRREGEVELRVVDLPGTYSLTSSSNAAGLAEAYLLDQPYDLIINVVDFLSLL